MKPSGATRPRDPAPAGPVHGPRQGSIAWLLASALVSGGASLVQQVVWVRRLGELLGSGPLSVAVVLSLFFAGLGLGARWAGPVADRRRGPLGLVLWVEAALVLCALAFLPLAQAAEALWIRASLESVGSGLGFKALLAALLVVPPSFCMGAQLPALVRHAMRRPASLGRRVALLYGWNTAGAALGAGCAGFLLLPHLGPLGALVVAAALHALAGCFAWIGRVDVLIAAPLDRTAITAVPWASSSAEVSRARARRGRANHRRTAQVLAAAALLSGLVSVGLEVVWTRALAARLSGTVYSYSSVLTTYLLAVGLGGLVAARLVGRGALVRPARAVAALGAVWLGLGAAALLSGALVAHLAPLGSRWTEVVGEGRFLAGQAREVLFAASVVAPAMFFAGLQLPLLVALEGRGVVASGRALGRVLALNAVGTAAAPLLIGLVLVPQLGLSLTVALLGWAAVAFGLWLAAVAARALGRRPAALLVRALPALLVAGGAQLAMGSGPLALVVPPGARLLAYQDGLSAGIAVVEMPNGNRVLELDGDYRLGDLGTRFAQARQGLLPLLIATGVEPAAESILHIGLGTGTSAAALLDAGARRLDIAEIVPDLAWTLPYFAAANGDLSRRLERGEARLLALDARDYVRRTPGRHGLVVGDLFVPWRAGEGAMYTREHFRAVRDSLAEHGLFVQWLPLYQLAEGELAIVTRTFLEVFPGAGALWLYYNAAQPAAALVGAKRPMAAPELSELRARLGAFAAGSPALAELLDPRDPALEVGGLWIADGELLARWCEGAPVERRLRPRIEFAAPRALAQDGGRRTARALGAFTDLARNAAGTDPDPVRGARRLAVAEVLSGQSLWLAGDATGGFARVRAALQADPGFGFAGFVLEDMGADFAARGEWDLARVAAEVLLGGGARPAGGECLLAILAAREGDGARARGHLERALALDPAHPRARAMQAAGPPPPRGPP